MHTISPVRRLLLHQLRDGVRLSGAEQSELNPNSTRLRPTNNPRQIQLVIRRRKSTTHGHVFGKLEGAFGLNEHAPHADVFGSTRVSVPRRQLQRDIRVEWNSLVCAFLFHGLLG